MRTESGSKKRVLVVDDSALYRRLIRKALEGLEGVEVVGEAHDGRDALRSIDSLQPELMTLDVEMPVLDGLGVLQALQERRHDVRVLMLSSLTRAGAETTVRALCLGASDFLLKPKAANSEQALERLRSEFARKLVFPGHETRSSSLVPDKRRVPCARNEAARVLGIGVSTGGPQALHTLFGRLPRAFPVPIVVVQHMPKDFTEALARSLNEASEIQVEEARVGMALEAGRALIAPGDQHLEVAGIRAAACTRLSDGPPELGCRPSVNVLLRSIAKIYGSASLGLIMTGMGDDGLEGARSIVECGGTVLAQDETSSAVFGMPRCVVEAGLAHGVLALDDLPAALTRLASAEHEAA